uniref:Ig-like domain-containing protein n=1 Tax=Oncorhynchus mykiss TaxID=8022 RepID=A0A8C7Q5P0_ONCMY
MARICVPALVLYSFCKLLSSVQILIDLVFQIVVTVCVCSLTPVISVSLPPSVVVHPGDNVTLQCTDVLKVPGHVAWFKQVNVSEPLCIASMYSSHPYAQHHNGFQPSHVEMLFGNRIFFLKITEVDVADSGLYFCGMYNHYFIFTNMTVLMVQGNLLNDFSCNGTIGIVGEHNDGTMYLLPLVVILGVVTAVLPIVILILVLKIRQDANRHNQFSTRENNMLANLQNQDPDTLNYAMEKRREKELDPHVVYAATR